MYIAKERVLLDKDNKCVKADDPKGVQVLAGFKGAKISEKVFATVKGADAFFDADNLSKEKHAPKRVLGATPEDPKKHEAHPKK